MALCLAGIDRRAPLKIADIGCGTGASTLLLARLLDAQITAVDFLQDFLDVLNIRAQTDGVASRIETLCAAMDDLPFAQESFDVIWSEGAIYNMGFAAGVSGWRRYIKPDGLLVVSEITWTTATRPQSVHDYWETQYPEIATASAKIKVLEDNGYSPVGYFMLSDDAWLENYYGPLEAGFADFLSRHGHSQTAQEIVTAERHEIDLYKQNKAFYSYGVYIARKLSD